MELYFSHIMKLIKHRSICNGKLHPISAQIDLSNYCNLSCAFCTHGADHLIKATVDLVLLDKILNKLYVSGCKGIEYTGGGEPLSHPKFAAIIKKTKAMFDVGLVTNGTLIKNFDKNIWNGFDWIRVSINAGPKNYEAVHGKNKISDVMGGLSILDKNSSFYGVSYIYFGQEASDICDLSKELNAFKNLKYLRIARDVLKPIPDQFTIDSILNSAKSQLNENVQVLFQIDRNMWVPEKCTMYKIKPRIDVFGNFFPCCVAHYKKIHSLGSILDFDFDKEVDIDTNKCPYCIYGCANEFCLETKKSSVKNKNFI